MQKSDPLPDRIGPYRVQRQLSATGSARVYLAREEGPMGFARDVVLKLVVSPSADDAEAVKEVAREATICARLNHPGIVRTYHFFEHEEALCLVLEYVEGIALAALLASASRGVRRLSDDAALHVGVSILDALAHAHAMVDEQGTSTPVVHRAVTPSHVMLGRDGTVKLAGFGFAKILEGSADTKTSLKWEPAYMAPEQATDEKVTPKWDVYAAGLILWELLSGRSSLGVPAQPLAIRETLRLVAERKLEPLSELRRDLPRELSAAVDAALVSSPAKRTITCAEMAQWIRKSVQVGRGKKELRERVSADLLASGTLAASAASGTTVGTQAAANASPARGVRRREATLLGIAPPAPAPPETPPPSSTTQGRALRPGPSVSPGRVPRSPGIGGASAPKSVPAPAGAGPVAAVAAADPVVSPKPVVGASENVDAFLQTMAAVEPPPAPTYSVPPPRGLHSDPPADGSPEAYLPTSFIERLQAPIERLKASIERLKAPIERLKAPTPFRRRPWLFAWIALGVVGLVLLVWRLTSSQAPSARVASSAPEASSESPGIALLPSQSAPPPVSSAVSALPAPAPPASSAEMADSSRLPQGFGYLTVHSSSPLASVYVQLARYGRVEDVLSVPCGKRLVSIGIPTRKRREPVWLAPSKTMIIPCGGLLETTMEPQRIRQRRAPDRRLPPEEVH